MLYPLSYGRAKTSDDIRRAFYASRHSKQMLDLPSQGSQRTRLNVHCHRVFPTCSPTRGPRPRRDKFHMVMIAELLATGWRYHPWGEFARAEQAYRQLLQRDANNAQAWYLLGDL